MKANKLVIRTKRERYSKEKSAMYEAYGKDGMLICCLCEGMVDAFCAYSAVREELTVMDSSSANLLTIKVEASIKAAEKLLKGKFNNLIIFTDKPSEAVILAVTLFKDKSLDYFISLDSTSAAKDITYRFEEIVTEREKSELLCKYLSVFQKKKSVIITADDITKDVVSLLCTDEISCIAIVPPFKGKAVSGIPMISIKNITATIGKENNADFKSALLDITASLRIDIDDFIYPYLLNNINETDNLDIIIEICKRAYNIQTLEEEHGTSILQNAAMYSDHCFTGCIADGGAAYKNSENDCLDIIRYLVTKGLRYSKSTLYDISSMAVDLYDSYKLGLIFKTMIEAGYCTTEEDIRSFAANFIRFAERNDHLTPIDDSHSPSYFQRLDRIRCEQMETMLPYIPDSVFSMRDADGMTLLIIAAKVLNNMPQLFKLILRHTPDVNIIDESGSTALHYISDLECWDALVAAGADINIKDNDGSIPSLSFDDASLQKLLAKTEYADSDREYAERMLFSILDNCYSAETVYENEILIFSLLDIIKPTAKRKWDGYTPLMSLIIQEGYFPDIYDKMLSIGIDINAEDNSGNNTLRIAVLSPECTTAKIRYLIEHGADETPKQYTGSIATIAAGLFHIKSQEWNALWELSDKNIFSYHKKGELETPIMVALRYQNMEAVRFLFNHNAVPNDELGEIQERINRIKTGTVRTECIELFGAYNRRNSGEDKNGNEE